MGNPEPTPVPAPIPTPAPTPVPTTVSSPSIPPSTTSAPTKPGEGGFQIDEEYEKQLFDINTDYSNSIVSLSSGVAIKSILSKCFDTLEKHDFSVETKVIDNISDIVTNMSDTAAEMALEFEALNNILNNLDKFIENRIFNLDSLTDEQKQDIINKYEQYKNGRYTFSEFLEYIAGFNNGQFVAIMFGIPDNYVEGFIKTFVAETGKSVAKSDWLEQVLIDNTLYGFVDSWGLTFMLDYQAYGFAQGVAYAISNAIKGQAKKVLNGKASEFSTEILSQIASTSFGMFCMEATIISLVNMAMYEIQGDLDAENIVRSIGDGAAVAGADFAAKAVIAFLAESTAIPGWGQAALGALIVAIAYYGGSRLVDYFADQIWSDENMNFDHDRLIEELKENGIDIFETNKVYKTDSSVTQVSIELEENGAPRELVNFFKGSAGLYYDYSYDDSPEFRAIVDLFGSYSTPDFFSEEMIEQNAKFESTSADGKAYIDACHRIKDYYMNNRTNFDYDIYGHIESATILYLHNNGTFASSTIG